MAKDSFPLLSGGNLAAMSEMETIAAQLLDRTTLEADAFHSHVQSNTSDMASRTPLDADALTSLNRLSASNIAPETNEQFQGEDTTEAEAFGLQNEPSGNITNSESPNTDIQADSSSKMAKKLRRDQAKKEFAMKRRERRRIKRQLNPKAPSAYSKPKRMTAEEAKKAATAKGQALMTSANELTTAPLKARYSWMQLKSTVEGDDPAPEFSKNESAKKAAITEGQARTTSSKRQTTSSSKRRSTRKALVTSANELITLPLKSRYPWMNQSKSTAEKDGPASECSKDESAKKAAITEGQARTTSSKRQTTSSSKHRSTRNGTWP